MLHVTAYQGLQDLAERLCRASHTHGCGVDDHAVEFPQQIRHTQHYGLMMAAGILFLLALVVLTS